MLPNLPTLSELAKSLGYTTSSGRTWLKRHIKKAESQVARQLLHGPTPYRVNVSELRQACPELFPVEYNRAAAELRAELKRNRRRELQLRDQLEQLAEASYSLYENILDRIDQQRSAAITLGPMDEGHRFPLPTKREEQQTINGANDGPTIPEAPGAARH